MMNGGDMEILLVFGARSQTLRCANMLRASSYAAAVTDAPIFLRGSCTLAVRTDRAGFVYFTHTAGTYSSFKGAYDMTGGKYARIF